MPTHCGHLEIETPLAKLLQNGSAKKLRQADEMEKNQSAYKREQQQQERNPQPAKPSAQFSRRASWRVGRHITVWRAA
jgi:hypothetical protein